MTLRELLDAIQLGLESGAAHQDDTMDIVEPEVVRALDLLDALRLQLGDLVLFYADMRGNETAESERFRLVRAHQITQHALGTIAPCEYADLLKRLDGYIGVDKS